MTDPTPASFAAGRLLLLPAQTWLRDGFARGQAVLVEDGRFGDVGPAGAVMQRHPDLVPLPLPGHALLPGFVDAHHHLTQAFGKALAFGEPS